ncbi:hypothetical protein DT076_14865 [Desertihabitans brevis]|uniref:Uncharacterized protein n=1 Tax=Desertihabitans brevis TaxID=2268447 RepID=A0A367YRK9_9ACTN|nr:hypothetical protein [Desertihabitans brevis]RCK68526.1 hypothetical protein DT076_14865 [Desertihabitans brevis]
MDDLPAPAVVPETRAPLRPRTVLLLGALVVLTVVACVLVVVLTQPPEVPAVPVPHRPIG